MLRRVLPVGGTHRPHTAGQSTARLLAPHRWLGEVACLLQRVDGRLPTELVRVEAEHPLAESLHVSQLGCLGELTCRLPDFRMVDRQPVGQSVVERLLERTDRIRSRRVGSRLPVSLMSVECLRELLGAEHTQPVTSQRNHSFTK